MKKNILKAIIGGACIAVIGTCLYVGTRDTGKLDTDPNISESKDEESIDKYEEVTWVEYPTDNWSIEYPSNWVVRDDKSSVLFCFESPLNDDNDSFKENYSVAYVGHTKDYSDVDTYLNDTIIEKLKSDKYVVNIGEPEKLILLTNETVNKIYNNARKIRVSCKVSPYDTYEAYDTKKETQSKVADESLGEDQVVDVDNNVIETVPMSELNAEVDETDVISTETTEQQSVGEGEDTTEVYRDYIVIDNGGELYVFVSVMKVENKDKYVEIFDKALKSLNCYYGISDALDANLDNYRVKIDIEKTSSQEDTTENDVTK